MLWVHISRLVAIELQHSPGAGKCMSMSIVFFRARYFRSGRFTILVI
jgi:hypothetical protein